MKPSILLLFTALLLLSCKKEPSVNLVATLTPENTVVAAYEGAPLVMTLNFDKKLSEPIQLEGKIYNNYNRYINDNDYQHFLEYSTDLGANWEKGRKTFGLPFQKTPLTLSFVSIRMMTTMWSSTKPLALKSAKPPTNPT